jgi:hypothetical protein
MEEFGAFKSAPDHLKAALKAAMELSFTNFDEVENQDFLSRS